MKKHIQKIISFLLLTVNFSFFLQYKISGNTFITYAETNSNQGTETIIDSGKIFIHHINTVFYIEQSLYIRNRDKYSKDALNKIYRNAKEKIYDRLGLNYTDGMETPIYIVNYGAAVFNYNDDGDKRITIGKDYIVNNQTLPHEMTHVLLLHKLGKANFEKLNFSINEGLATQSESDFFESFSKKFILTFAIALDENIYFKNSCPDNTNIEVMCLYYTLHYYAIHDWIESEGKKVVEKFIEKVKNGEDSMESFRSLGGDKIIDKYNSEMKKLKPLAWIIKTATSFCSNVRYFYGKICEFKAQLIKALQKI